MKDKDDKSTGDLLQTPNARRQASFADRQRAMGRKQFKRWVTEAEGEALDALLTGLRAKEGKK